MLDWLLGKVYETQCSEDILSEYLIGACQKNSGQYLHWDPCRQKSMYKEYLPFRYGDSYMYTCLVNRPISVFSPLHWSRDSTELGLFRRHFIFRQDQIQWTKGYY